MSKNNIAQQYNSMVASIEDAKIYDGRGEYNLYECNKCNNYMDIKGNISCIASLWTLKNRLRASTTGNLKAAVFFHIVNPFVI